MDGARIAAKLAAAGHDAWRDAAGRANLHDEVGMGADGTPMTRIDRILDEAILAAAAPLDVSVVSEESGHTPGDGPLTALVDPLDGSRNAGRGIPFFCTSIAIATGPGLDGIVAGHVENLVDGTAYTAAGGPVHVDGQPATHRPFNADEVLVAVIADSSTDEIQQEQERRGHHVRDLGSAALELSLVATGALDAFLVRQPWLRNIDVAAGAYLVQQAGGVVASPDGQSLVLDFDVQRRLALVAARSPAALEAVT